MNKTKPLALILGVLIMSFLIGYLVFAWIEPTAGPPGGNVFAPLNVGDQPQAKQESLTFTEFIDLNDTAYRVNPSGNSYFSGTVGIGTANPSTNYKLDVQAGALLSGINVISAALGGSGIYASGHEYGVYGNGTKTGVYGATGVYGTGPLYGVQGFGTASVSIGVFGHGDTTGVVGLGGKTGVSGDGDNYGVSGSGGIYGVFGSGTIAGVYGTGGTYGLLASGTNYGARASGITYGIWAACEPGAPLCIALYVEGKTNTTGDLTVGGGTGKINVGTIDPIFDIDGKKYATYMADFAGGTRVETSGTIQLTTDSLQPKTVIDFDGLEKGSDLWLFWQTSNKNINDVAILLTPGFEGKVWYEKNGNKIIIYGDTAGEVSYRLSAPRADHQEWENLAEDQNLTGIKISDY